MIYGDIIITDYWKRVLHAGPTG